MVDQMIDPFEETNENKYLVLDYVDESKEVSKNCEEVWEGVFKQLIVAKKLNMRKIFKKLGLNLMMICP